jgi:hypothetical protein
MRNSRNGRSEREVKLPLSVCDGLMYFLESQTEFWPRVAWWGRAVVDYVGTGINHSPDIGHYGHRSDLQYPALSILRSFQT